MRQRRLAERADPIEAIVLPTWQVENVLVDVLELPQRELRSAQPPARTPSSSREWRARTSGVLGEPRRRTR